MNKNTPMHIVMCGAANQALCCIITADSIHADVIRAISDDNMIDICASEYFASGAKQFVESILPWNQWFYLPMLSIKTSEDLSKFRMLLGGLSPYRDFTGNRFGATLVRLKRLLNQGIYLDLMLDGWLFTLLNRVKKN
jgi:hypothetical protein